MECVQSKIKILSIFSMKKDTYIYCVFFLPATFEAKRVADSRSLGPSAQALVYKDGQSGHDFLATLEAAEIFFCENMKENC